MNSPEIGFFSQTGDPVILEIAARRGVSFVVVDVQHGPYSRVALRSQMQAIEAGGSRGFVRLSAVSSENVGAALDSGAQGVIGPLIDSAEDAQALVRFAKFPPAGVRSFGMSRQSAFTTLPIREVNERVEIYAMIETERGLDNVEAIAEVKGITGLYLGPTDLSIALGGTGYGDPAVGAAFEEAVTRILAAASARGKSAVFHGRTASMLAPRLEQGFGVGVLATELTLLSAALEANLSELRAVESGGEHAS